MNLESDKGNALKKLQEKLHILPEETMAFGDNMNDIGMLRAAGESYAVENAVPELKAMATAVIGGNDSDGVARWLESNYYPR